MLGKYGTIYKNYLKEYQKEMYNNLKAKGILDVHCKTRENELNSLKEQIIEQLKQNNPEPKTNDFFITTWYNQIIENTANELIIKEIEF